MTTTVEQCVDELADGAVRQPAVEGLDEICCGAVLQPVPAGHCGVPQSNSRR